MARSKNSQDLQHKTQLPEPALKKAVAAIRSKSKTRQLMVLCERIKASRLKTDWSAKYERLVRSPVWKLVSDEAIRKADFKCECWGCGGEAKQVHLLAFPQAHLEPGFDWMNRNNILIAVCGHHHQIVHNLLLKKVVA